MNKRKKNKAMDWKYGSSDRVPTLQAENPEFKFKFNQNNYYFV
jgi:hypothetical protein